MTARRIVLDKYDWEARLFVGYEREDAACLCQELAAIGCRDEALRSAYAHLSSGGEGSGLTYSNVRERVSVVAVGASAERGDMANTMGHELLHVVAHICGQDGIGMQGEEACYMMGELCEGVFRWDFFRTHL